MSLPVPNLDDRTFDQLATEARSLIPGYFPEWTDHNPSDPGIALLELFAFLIEAAIYQINRVPERSLERFAGLIGITRAPGEAIEQTLGRALDALEARYRAITREEYESLAKEAIPGDAIARARALVERADTPNVFPDEQTIKVIIVPNDLASETPEPTDATRQTVFEFLGSRRLITTRVRVLPPTYRDVRIETTVVRDSGVRLDKSTVQQNVEQAIRSFLSPLTGGVDGTGWEFGRSVFRSELYQVLEGIAGVDHVHQLRINGNETIGELPLAAAEASAELAALPAGLAFPAPLSDKIRYEALEQRLIVKGVMDAATRDQLLSLSPEPSYQTAIQKLFGNSPATSLIRLDDLLVKVVDG